MEQHLSDIDELAQKSWELYKPKMGFYALLILASGLIAFGIIIAVLVIVFLLMREPATIILTWFSERGPLALAQTDYARIAIAFALLIIVGILLSCWQRATVLSAVLSDKQFTIAGSLKRGLALMPRFTGTALMAGVLIVLGSLLFVIPGILLAGWYLFSDITVIRGAGVVEALKESKRLVTGRWWAVVGRFVLIALTAGIIPQLINAIPELFGFTKHVSPLSPMTWLMIALSFAVSVVSIFFIAPWLMTFKKVLYEDAARTAPSTQPYDTSPQTPHT